MLTQPLTLLSLSLYASMAIGELEVHPPSPFTIIQQRTSHFKLMKVYHHTTDKETISYMTETELTEEYIGVNILTKQPKIRMTSDMIHMQKLTRNLTHDYLFSMTENQTAHKIYVRSEVIGYVRLEIERIEMRNSERVVTDHLEYTIVVDREHRPVDIGFNGAVIIIAFMNTLSLGCVTDLSEIKRWIRDKKKEIGLTALVQYVIAPLFTYGLCKILQVQNQITVGFLLATCIPGGGLSFLIVSITSDTDRDNSILHNFIQMFAPLVAIPLWLYSLSPTLVNTGGISSNRIYLLVFWTTSLWLPYFLGIHLRKRSEDTAQALLNWLVKPFLLLACILFFTLGLYINMYMFSVLDSRAMAVGALIPFVGFGTAGGIILITRLGKPAAKTAAIESAIMNSIIVIIATRFTLSQPDADFASAAVMWLLFITPVPFVLMFIFHRIKRKVMSYFDKKAFEKSHEQTLQQSFAAITQNAFQLGGLVKPMQTNNENNNKRKTIDDDELRPEDTTLLLMESGSSGISADGGHVIVNKATQRKESADSEVCRVSFDIS